MRTGKGILFRIRGQDESRRAFSSVQGNMRRTQTTQRSWNAGLNANRRAVQQFGFQMTDFATQVAGGQSAMLAFTQQGGQMLQFFGPGGAIAAAFLAVFGSLAIAFTRSGAALSDLNPLLGIFREEFVLIGNALSTVKELMIDFANIVVNNMDRIFVTATVLAGLMAGRWVAGFVAARVATLSFAAALGVLKVALLRTGIGALILAVGELFYQFSRVGKAANDFGVALSLTFDLVKEIAGRIMQSFQSMALAAKSSLDSIVGNALLMVQGVLDGVETLANKFIGLFAGAFEAVKAMWELLPAVFSRVGALAINGLVGAMEAGLSGLTTAMNSILTLGGQFPDMAIPAPDLSGWRSAVPEVASAGSVAAEAFSNAFNGTFVGNGVVGGAIGDAGDAMLARSEVIFRQSQILRDRFDDPLEALQAIRELLNTLPEDAPVDIRDLFGGGGDDDTGGGSRGSGSDAVDEAEETAKKIKALFDDVSSSISNALSTNFNALREGTKSLADAIDDTLSSILNKIQDIMLQPVWDFIANAAASYLIGTPGATGLSGGIFSGSVNKVNSFSGGGHTGYGTRSGGIDGKGGRLTITHPRETWIDHTRPGGGGGGAAPSVEVHIHGVDGANQPEVRTSDGRVDVIFQKAMVDNFATGRMDRAMTRYGLKPQAR